MQLLKKVALKRKIWKHKNLGLDNSENGQLWKGINWARAILESKIPKIQFWKGKNWVVPILKRWSWRNKFVEEQLWKKKIETDNNGEAERTNRKRTTLNITIRERQIWKRTILRRENQNQGNFEKKEFENTKKEAILERIIWKRATLKRENFETNQLWTRKI